MKRLLLSCFVIIAGLLIAAISATSVSADGNSVTIRAVDSQGNPLAGVEVSAFKPNVGGVAMGTTDVNGEATANLPWSGNGIVFTARYAKSSASAAVNVAAAGNPIPLHIFQTTKATIAVKDCTGKAVEGTKVDYFVANSGGGAVGTIDASGVVSTELFPGTYRFTANINRTYANMNVDITAGNPVDYAFAPTLVTFTNPFGLVSMWQNNIGGTVFNGPTYIFPGTYTIDFYQGLNQNTKLYSSAMKISGCTFTKGFVRVDARNSQDSALGGVEVSAFKPNVGGATIGVTDATGTTYGLLPWTGNGIVLTARYAKSSATAKVDVTPSSGLLNIFRTTQAVIAVKDSAGNAIAGADVTYFVSNSGGGTVGTTTVENSGVVSTELFPGAYAFTARFNRTSATTNVDITAGTPIDYAFQTTQAVIAVKDSAGNAIAGANVTYFVSNSGGGTVGTTTVENSGVVSTELFPGAYAFTARFNRTSATTNVDITAGTPIDHTFTPTLVEFFYTAGRVSMWQNNNGSTVFNGPTYIFPGTYTIDFYRGNAKVYVAPLTIGDNAVSMTLPRLVDASGNGVAGASAMYKCEGTDQLALAGVTDANGWLLAAIDPCFQSISMTLNDWGQEQLKASLEASQYTFILP